MSINEPMAVREAARSKQQVDSLERQLATLRSKAAKQRNEVARLTKAVEELHETNKRLTAQIKWMRGET